MRQGAHAELETRIVEHRAHVVVLGLGHVGLPLAVEFAQAGFPVTGVDIDAQRIARLERGESYVTDVSSEELEPLVRSERLRATVSASVLDEADLIFICVPTPMSKSREPDMSYIKQAVETVRQHLHPGTLVVLESTTYPGTTEDVVLPWLQATGLELDRDFYLAFSPERIDPGNRRYRLRDIPKLVGGASPQSAHLAALAYQQIIPTVHVVSSARVAEMAKLLENTFRAVNIALVNEFALICRALDIDVWEVIEAAATKPFGFMPFSPGPGIGGACLPVNPGYLVWKSRRHGFEPRLIGVAEEINRFMPYHAVDLIVEALNVRGKPVKGARLLILGVAYKRDVGDVRESPAVTIMEELLRRGADVAYSDPHVERVEIGTRVFQSVPMTAETLATSDGAVIVTDHSAFDYSFIVEHAPLVVDLRNATRDLGRRPNVVRL
ncbi:MAG: nucleotide sugar dehydrogenase [Blastocatellia bacterium]|nr:nucleotide sugar dehydrogenase [Blastocatellia bacterium]MCX7752243.1 nucleotide sugar dehydrogenase [Blastocatellia bacterium]